MRLTRCLLRYGGFIFRTSGQSALSKFLENEDKKDCVGRESNPGQLLGRQLCSPLYHRRFCVEFMTFQVVTTKTMTETGRRPLLYKFRYETPWRNGSASDSRSEGCVFESRRGQTFPFAISLHVNEIAKSFSQILPRPGFEPGLLRPQRRVLTTRRSRLVTLSTASPIRVLVQ